MVKKGVKILQRDEKFVGVIEGEAGEDKVQ